MKLTLLARALLAALLASSSPAQDEAAGPDAFVAFVSQLEHTVLEGDADFFRASLDFDALLATVTEGVDAPPAFFDAFSKGIRSSFDLAEQVTGMVQSEDGSYTFLRMLPGDRALFRLSSDSGLNYHELYLRVDADDRVTIVDLYVHASGELVSATMRRPYLAAATGMNRGLLERLVKRESDYVAALPRIQAMMQAAQTDPAEALEAYASLPESVRHQPEMLLMRSQIAALVSDEAYLAALTDFARHHPDSPALDLMLIDFHILRSEFDQALERIDAVDERVGGDPYLDVLRGNVLWQAGRIEEAKQAANRGAVRDARLEYEVWWLLLDIALDQEDHAATLTHLIALEEEYGVEWMDLTEFEAYAAFVASPEYERWKSRLAAVEEEGG